VETDRTKEFTIYLEAWSSGDRKAADQRGGIEQIRLDEAADFSQKQDVDSIDLNETLRQFAEQDELQRHIVELKLFGGLSIEETAEVLKIPPATFIGQ